MVSSSRAATGTKPALRQKFSAARTSLLNAKPHLLGVLLSHLLKKCSQGHIVRVVYGGGCGRDATGSL